jgi:hypothetical protein
VRALCLVFAVACTTTPAPAPNGPVAGALRCELRDYAITAVDASREPGRSSKLSSARVRGAELFVQAQPNLTAEWLRLVLARHVEAARRAKASPDCPLDVGAPEITVESSGPGFTVRILSTDEADAAEILRRARALTSAPGG